MTSLLMPPTLVVLNDHVAQLHDLGSVRTVVNLTRFAPEVAAKKMAAFLEVVANEWGWYIEDKRKGVGSGSA